MKTSLFWRLNLILITWALLGMVLLGQAAQAKSLDQSSQANEHLQNTNLKIEKAKTRVDLNNAHAPPISQGVEFVKPNNSSSHGVDMRLAPALPNYDYDPSYVPNSSDAAVESEIQDQQTTDYVVERSWLDIRREIRSSQTPQ